MAWASQIEAWNDGATLPTGATGAATRPAGFSPPLHANFQPTLTRRQPIPTVSCTNAPWPHNTCRLYQMLTALHPPKMALEAGESGQDGLVQYVFRSPARIQLFVFCRGLCVAPPKRKTLYTLDFVLHRAVVQTMSVSGYAGS